MSPVKQETRKRHIAAILGHIAADLEQFSTEYYMWRSAAFLTRRKYWYSSVRELLVDAKRINGAWIQEWYPHWRK